MINDFFTDKIIDCFLTGTIPIYHGCQDISDYFDIEGIIIFNENLDLSDLNTTVSWCFNLEYDIFSIRLESTFIIFPQNS